MGPNEAKIVLAASDSESSEYLRSGKLYLDLAKGTPKYRVPERVEVPSHDMRPIMPEAY